MHLITDIIKMDYKSVFRFVYFFVVVLAGLEFPFKKVINVFIRPRIDLYPPASTE